MPRWKKGSNKFTVSVTPHKSRGYSEITIPKPIIEALGNPGKIAFVITEKGIEVLKAEEEAEIGGL